VAETASNVVASEREEWAMDRKLTIVFFDAGGGHRSAAEALKRALETQPQPWEVRLLNLQELLDKLDLLRKVTGIRIQDGYNLILRKGWTRFTPQLLPVLQGFVRMYHRPTPSIGKRTRLILCFPSSPISTAHWLRACAKAHLRQHSSRC